MKKAKNDRTRYGRGPRTRRRQHRAREQGQRPRAKEHARRTAAGTACTGQSDELDAAASYLGTTAASLLTQLQAGKTLAQVATATNGKSTAGLVAALVAAEKTEIAAAVTSGKLTQAQADQITPTLTQRFTDLVNGVHPAGGPGPGGGFGHGPGGVGTISPRRPRISARRRRTS